MLRTVSRLLPHNTRKRIYKIGTSRLLRPHYFGSALIGRTLKPSFLIIGAQKAGTTSLFRYLLQHPDVKAPTRKQVHFFDLNFSHGERWYFSHFPPKLNSQTKITGEASTEYLFHPEVAQRAKAILPNIQIIVLLRDPVERAYSHFHHMKRAGRELLSFENAIERELEIFSQRGGFDFTREDVSDIYNQSYLARGFYATQLERWFVHFPREQFLILQSEQFFQKVDTIFADVVQHLGLSNDYRVQNKMKHNSGVYTPMKPSTRKKLELIFETHNQYLSDLIGVDYGW